MNLTIFYQVLPSNKTPLLPTKSFFSLLASLTYVSISLLLLNLHGFVLLLTIFATFLLLNLHGLVFLAYYFHHLTPYIYRTIYFSSMAMYLHCIKFID
jgi:hypothetical protein